MRLNIEIDIETIEKFDTEDTVARVHYPDEGNKIVLKKGLNTIELSEAIHHEIGHLLDWYLSTGGQSKIKKVREGNARTIGESLRWGNPSIFINVADPVEKPADSLADKRIRTNALGYSMGVKIDKDTCSVCGYQIGEERCHHVDVKDNK